MKPSDFVSTSEQKNEAAQSVLQTEMTDAVNSGIVGRADKSAKALKGDLYSTARKSTKGGAASAALSSAGKGKMSAGKAGAAALANRGVHKALEGTELEGADDLYHGAKGAVSAARTIRKRVKGKQNPIDIKGGLKSAGKAATRGVVNDTLQDSELEGLDTVYDASKVAYHGARKLKRRSSHEKTNPLAPAKTLGKLSEKKSSLKPKDAADSKRKAQAAGYFKRNVYSTAENARKAATTTRKSAKLFSKGTGNPFAALAGTVSPALIILGLLAALLFLVPIMGGVSGAAKNAQDQQAASLEGMPKWVSYDLVLSCLKAHEEYGYPASALLGQMMIENGTSDEGSELGRKYHNYGGIKYFGKVDGLIVDSVRMLTTEYVNGTPVRVYADFAVFASDDAYMKYRCEHLYKQPNYTSVPDFQRAIDENNSELFLKALGEGGYYTSPPEAYLANYRSICNAYPLVAQLDSMTSEQFAQQFGGTHYPGGGQDYASAEPWQKNIVDCCHRVSWPGPRLCATWTSNVYAAAGYQVGGNGNTCLGDQGYGANYLPSRATTDLSQIKVGMLVSAQFGSNTSAGNTYGHVGIYVGDGMVMDSINTGLRSISLNDWVSQNNRGWVVCGYPWDWR